MKIFIVQEASLTSSDLGPEVHLFCKAQIGSLKADETLPSVTCKYVDFVNIYSKNLAIKLSKYTRINSYAIKLVESQQTPYRSSYSLGLVKLKILKSYIETNLATSFIRRFKFLASASILFIKKPNNSSQLFGNYQDLNNLTIKNWYPLLLISMSLDWLAQAKHFT